MGGETPVATLVINLLLYNLDRFHQTWQVFLKGAADPEILVPATKATRPGQQQGYAIPSANKFTRTVAGNALAVAAGGDVAGCEGGRGQETFIAARTESYWPL